MAQCKYCGKKGLFLSVDKNGLCKSCSPRVQNEIVQRGRIIIESLEIVKTTKNFSTKVSRIETILQYCQELLKYENRGITTIDPPPSAVINIVKSEKQRAIEDDILLQVEKCIDKAKLAKTVASKINNANNALIILKDSQTNYGYENPSKIKEISMFIHKVQFDEHYIKAQKEEFKGNMKKALDQYLEALFFLKSDDIDDDSQRDIIEELENRIEKLKSGNTLLH